MILVNFKLYKETFGDGALKLAEICKKVSQKSGVKIIPVVSVLDAVRIKEKLDMEVYLQAVDEFNDGAKTGFTSPFQAASLKIDGSILNHSEHRIKPGTVKKMLADWPKDFKSVVCISSLGQAEGWAKNIKPDIIAYEPKEFIGNKEKSVASEKPEIIKKIVEKYPKIPILVGAGIHSKEDVSVSLKLGAKGVLISTFIIKAKDPEKELTEIASAF
ncbi:MAG: triose-phosphate isomerase [Candidatus Shapirobacteria bacterium]|nr:triose-phosphate isomerase [Candidatus Shapirobacteria bacterium]MDD4383414.1 triose-phosphate isomerase [Candidatus Shapirobacteria bacterium]